MNERSAAWRRALLLVLLLGSGSAIGRAQQPDADAVPDPGVISGSIDAPAQMPLDDREVIGGPDVEPDVGPDVGPDVEGLSGRALMRRVHDRHQQYPFVFEQQSMVLEDRDGARETRVLRRFSRVDDDGTARILLLFDAPREVEGVALLAQRGQDGQLDVSVYLPALRGEMIGSDSDGASANFLGTDFTIENLVGEVLDDYRYVRRRTRNESGVPHHQVDVFARDDDPVTARPLRRHFIRADNLFIARSEHFDGLGRVQKRQTVHDLRAVDGTMWRGNLILMEDLRARHSTLLRIERRVFSRDYVPAEMFSAAWILANHPYRAPEPVPDADGDERQPDSDTAAPSAMPSIASATADPERSGASP